MIDREKLELQTAGAGEAGVNGGSARTAGGKKRLTVMGVEFVYLMLFGILCAFLGWLAENTARLATQGILDSRFHILPFLSPYALIPFAFQILLGNPDKITVFGRRLYKDDSVKSKILSNLTCLLLMYMAVFLGEIVVGNLCDTLFNVQLWNYNNLPFHITQYTGLIPVVGYGTGAYLIFRFIYKPVLELIRGKISFNVAKTICIVLFILIALDDFSMVMHIAFTNTPPVYWSIKLF